MKKAPPVKKATPWVKAIPWIVVVVVAVVIGFFLFKPAAGTGVKNVDSAELLAAQAKGAQVVDVRTAGEFQLGHITGAINVPVDELQATAQSWDRNATYVVYCASGARSAQAIETMTSMGFKSLDHFNQGIQAWTGPLEKGQATSSQGKVPTNGKPVFIEFYTDS
jgi:thioredoxin 1